ncbi:mitogen-activated protein kinase kinase kinase [Aspergillus terreus]
MPRDAPHDQYSPNLAAAVVHNPQQGTPSHGTDLNKSPSHRQNNNNTTLPGGMSPSEAGAQWPLEKVLLWLAVNGFSKDWQETFRVLELQGTDFLELGHGFNGRPNPGRLYNVVYPQLAKECEASGTGWDQAREREEGKRMRRLIRQIQESGNYDQGIPVNKRRDSQNLPASAAEGTLEASPKLAHEHTPLDHSSGAIANSPLRAPQSAQSNRRSFTTPLPGTYDHPATDLTSGETTMWPRADVTRAAMLGINEYRGLSPAGDGPGFPPTSRPYENSPKSGSPAAQYATISRQTPSSSTGDLNFKHSRDNSSDSATGRRYYESFRQDNVRPSPQETHARHPSGEIPASYHSKDHSNRILHFFKKRSKDSSQPSPEEQFLESPTSPVNTRQNSSTHLYARPNFSNSDMSLAERPSSSSVSDHERLAPRPKPMHKGKKWAFVTLDGWTYRLVDITDMDSVETLRAAICQSLGISDWPGTQIFQTEPGQAEHEEPLNDTNLALCRRMKADASGSLKLLVRGSSMHPSTSRSPSNFTGLAISMPDKLSASSPTATHHSVPRKELDEEALNRLAHPPGKPTSPQSASRPRPGAPVIKQGRDVSQGAPRLSPVDAVHDSADPDSANFKARVEEHKREVERKQQVYRKSKVPPVYSETGFRREGVIDFDSPRISPYEDKRPSDNLVPQRRPPTAPGLQSRKSYGPDFDFPEPSVPFEGSPMPQEDSDDDSDEGLFAKPLANRQTPTKDKGSAVGTQDRERTPRKPSLTVNTETRLKKGLSVSFRSPSATREGFGSAMESASQKGSSSEMGHSPEDEKPPRRDSFARDVWASRPPVEGVIDHLDDFFPDIDLDAPYLDGQGVSPPSSPAARAPADNELNQKERQAAQAPAEAAASTMDSAEPTVRPHDAGFVARRNVNRSGGLTRMKSIREVAKGANQAHRHRSSQSTGNQKSGEILRRKSTKMFGAKIMQISPRPGTRVSQLDPIPQNAAAAGGVPQRQPTFRIIRGQLIGKGTYGRVYLGMNADNGEVLAVKQVEINPRIAGQDKERIKDMVAALNQEIDTMQHLEHPNIVQYLGCERGELSISIYLEYISGGSIGSCLRKHGKFEESVVKSLTWQTLSGLAYLHDRGILHRDLKADNILLDLDGTCKISDFGISKKTDNIYGNDSTNSMQGSVFWMAPEVIHSQGQGYSAKVDIWSLGCVVLEMFAGRRPWSKEEAIGAIFKLGSLSQAPPIPDDVSLNISPAALAFMDSSDRPTAQTLLTQHPFCEPDPKYNFLDTELYAKIRHVL